MKLTFEIFQEPETPNQWIGFCKELDIISGHTQPEVAIEALAEAVRMTLAHEMKNGMSCNDAFETIKAHVLTRQLQGAVDDLKLSNRAMYCLQNARVKNIVDLVQKTESEMRKIKNLGNRTLQEIKERLAERGLQLGMKLGSHETHP